MGQEMVSLGNVAITRAGKAMGDLVQTTPVLRRLKDAGAERLDVWAAEQNKAILENNPYVDNVFTLLKDPDPEENDTVYDRVFSLGGAVEGTYCFKTNKPYPTLEERRKTGAGINFFEAHVAACGLPLDGPILPDLYFSEEENREIDALRFKKGRRFWIAWHPVGTTEAKIWTNVYSAVRFLFEKFQQTEHWIFGEMNAVVQQEEERIHFVRNEWPVRKVLNFLRACDLFIGSESFLASAAGAFPALHKIVYYTTGAPETVGKDFNRHYPITSKAPCSPCYLIPLNFRNQWELEERARARSQYLECIQHHPRDMFLPLGYKCIMQLDEQALLDQAVRVIRGRA